MYSKIIFFLLFTVLITIPNNIIAQNQEEVVVDFPLAYTQSVVRSPQGDLLVYQENYAPRISNSALFNEFLNQQLNQDDAELILLDLGDRTMEMIQLQTSEVFEFDQLRSWDQLGGLINDEQFYFVTFFHEGYPVSKGDIITINWTFVRQS